MSDRLSPIIATKSTALVSTESTAFWTANQTTHVAALETTSVCTFEPAFKTAYSEALEPALKCAKCAAGPSTDRSPHRTALRLAQPPALWSTIERTILSAVLSSFWTASESSYCPTELDPFFATLFPTITPAV